MGSSSESEDNGVEEGEFFVEAIQEHMYYEQAFCLRNKIAFTPNCKNEIEHSKYVFLTKWKDYGDEDATWEPEVNLLDLGLLREYKKKHNLPECHEKFKRLFNWAARPGRSLTCLPNTKYKKREKSPVIQPRPRSPVEKVKKPKRPKKVYIDSDEDDDVSTTITTSRSISGTSINSNEPITYENLFDDPEGVVKPPVPVPPVVEAPKKEKKKNSKLSESPVDDKVELVRYTVEDMAYRGLEEQVKLFRKRRWSSAENLNERWKPAVNWKAEEEARTQWNSVLKDVVKHMSDYKQVDLNAKKAILFMAKHENSKTGKLCWKVRGPEFRTFLKSMNFSCFVPILEQPTPASKVQGKSQSPVVTNIPIETPTLKKSEAVNRFATNHLALTSSQIEKVIIDCSKLSRNLKEKYQINLKDEMTSPIQKIAIEYSSLEEMKMARLLRTIQDKRLRFYIICELVKCVRIQVLEDLYHPEIKDDLVKRLLCSEYIFSSPRNVLNTVMDICEKKKHHKKCLMMVALISSMPPIHVFLDKNSPFHVDNFGFTMLYGSQCQKVMWLLHGVPANLCIYHMRDVDIHVTPFMIAFRQRNVRYMLDLISLGINFCNRGYLKVQLTSEKCAVSWTGFIDKLKVLSPQLLSDPTHIASSFNLYCNKYIPLIERLLRSMAHHTRTVCQYLLQRSGLSFELNSFFTQPLVFRVTRNPEYTAITQMKDSCAVLDNKFVTRKTFVQSMDKDKYKVFLVVSPIDFVGGTSTKKGESLPINVRPATGNSRVLSASMEDYDFNHRLDLPLSFHSPNEGYMFSVPTDKLEQLVDMELLKVTLRLEGNRNDLFLAQVVCLTP